VLDERKIQAALLKAQGIEVTKIAETIGISRATFYNWLADEEFKAELCRLRQEFITQGSDMVACLTPKVIKKIAWLMDHSDSDKVKLDAATKLLDKTISNATKITLDDSRDDKDNVTTDILDAELKEFDE
jgi:AcrR family transcriptional regulator